MISTVMGDAPGMIDTSGVTTYERSFRWGPTGHGLVLPYALAAAAVDSGASPTYRLRPGLLLGKITSSGKLTNYSPTATDGSAVAVGVLMTGLRMSDVLTGSTNDKFVGVLVAGPVRASAIINLDQKARGDMFGRFIFDDDPIGNSIGWRNVVAKTADYTVTAADNNITFTNQGAAALVTFTLPTLAKGLRFRFYSEDNDGISVISAGSADDIVTHNDATADSVTFSTTGRNIGAGLEVFANATATKWLTFPFTWNVADDGSTTSKAVIA